MTRRGEAGFPSTLDFENLPTGDRLEASGSWNALVTHRVRLGSRADVDDELIGWLRQAYDEAGAAHEQQRPGRGRD